MCEQQGNIYNVQSAIIRNGKKMENIEIKYLLLFQNFTTIGVAGGEDFYLLTQKNRFYDFNKGF
jgi:hypothetical protein